jgi:alanyl-tRNA synthetase
MTSAEIRQQFLDFFKSKGHDIVASAPIVVKNDPTLMFTNAGMNQFKDFFLGNDIPKNQRITDTQKCLRVSGKHNDLEEVGVDTYHHTMFEMLGNWSFGDYFKTEAIAWSWELLTEVYKIDKERMYVSIFEGDEKEGIPRDDEAFNEWKKVIAEDRILLGNKKDNFWEMGDTGPCGPCTEIHVDMRSDEERKLVSGKELVNNDHPQVIEIWNNVFIQFNRKKDGSLEPLPAKHVDTGMGFERLVRVIQGKSSNYDTDVFTNTIAKTEEIVNIKYDYSDSKQAIAFRVLADHIRAISFAIADGQLPSNTGAGYVIRRILRRAVRYYFSCLHYKQPLMHQLVSVIATQFEHVFPELKAQEQFVTKVILEEENSFLKTLENGISIMSLIIDASLTNQTYSEFEKYMNSNEGVKVLKNVSKYGVVNNGVYTIGGEVSFLLYDTFGFPIDLIKLIASENNVLVNENEFEEELQKQKSRSRKASEVDTEDWIELLPNAKNDFVGYDTFETTTKIIKYRKVSAKGKTLYQIVLEQTPFYAESGGQVGDIGQLRIDNYELRIIDTKKENDLIIHISENILDDMKGNVVASIDKSNRRKITRHHTATHLLQAALQQVLGKHIAQKGSMNNADGMRFDFSHFAKMTDDEIAQVEKIVNQKIRQNIPVIIQSLAKDEAMKLGAMALFGEKYGDVVRVVIIDPAYSIELCGGTHVANTGELGIFKITSESAIASGVRRMEALAGCKAEAFINAELRTLNEVKTIFKNPKDVLKSITTLQEEKNSLQKQLDKLEARALVGIRNELLVKSKKIKTNNTEITFIGENIEVSNADSLKRLCLDFKNEIVGDYLICLTANIGGKASIAIAVNDNSSLDAGKIIKETVAPLIQGGGGGNKTLATAGGQDASKLNEVIEKVKGLV